MKKKKYPQSKRASNQNTASACTGYGYQHKKIQTASEAATSRCKRGWGGGTEWRKREEEEVGKKRKGWRTWAGEMSAPQGGRPVLSTANRRGKHLQDKQSAHYLGEHWHCRQQDTSLQKHHCSYTWEASFQNARATFGSKMLRQDSNRIPIKLTRKYLEFYDHSFIFTFIVSNLFFLFFCFLK